MDDTLPPPIKVTSSDSSDGSHPEDDDSLVDIKVKNPFFRFFDWFKKLIKGEGIKAGVTIKPLTAIAISTAIFSTGGISFISIAKIFFPTSSPILHRQVVNQGAIQKGEMGQYYLILSDSSLWKLKPKVSTINLANLTGKQVIVTGNLTKEPNLIEVSEVIIFDNNSQSDLQSLNSLNSPSPLNTPDPAPSDAGSGSPDAVLPDLYPNLQWETKQRRTLIFTSGKRKIEQEGVYLESSQLNSFPQDFINYYIQEFKNKGFKETFNSISPDGITITYAKDDLFLTFGTKNKYSGSGDKKQLVGYTAFIEHN